MKYIIVLYAAGYIVSLINAQFYYDWLMLDIDKLLKGQVWRLVTFLIQPAGENIFFLLITLYLYYFIGNTLERMWGAFRFNLYYLMGILANILTVVIIYLITYFNYGTGCSYPISLEYLNMSLFLAFAFTFPEMRFLFMFIVPVKAKYFSIFYAVIFAIDVVEAFTKGGFLLSKNGSLMILMDKPVSGICMLTVIIVSLSNFFLFMLMTRKIPSPAQIKRKIEYSRSYTQGMKQASATTVTPDGNKVITRHKCAVCGRTEADDENLEFRFCSKCSGDLEYCQDHLFTHEHVQ